MIATITNFVDKVVSTVKAPITGKKNKAKSAVKTKKCSAKCRCS